MSAGSKTVGVSHHLSRNFCLLWVVMVGVSNQLHKHLDDKIGVKGWYPTVLDGLSANFSVVGLDVGVIDLCNKLHLWALEGIVVAKIDFHGELSAGVR